MTVEKKKKNTSNQKFVEKKRVNSFVCLFQKIADQLPSLANYYVPNFVNILVQFLVDNK